MSTGPEHCYQKYHIPPGQLEAGVQDRKLLGGQDVEPPQYATAMKVNSGCPSIPPRDERDYADVLCSNIRHKMTARQNSPSIATDYPSLNRGSIGDPSEQRSLPGSVPKSGNGDCPTTLACNLVETGMRNQINDSKKKQQIFFHTLDESENKN